MSPGRSRPQRPVGIRDVAEAAGVSITTVSHALSGKGRLPEETRSRVRGVAAELGYAPNAAARSLAGGRTGLLATFVSLPGNASLAFTEIDYYVDLINAATTAAIERGYALVIAPSTAGGETWSRLPLDGAIVIDAATGDAGLRALRRRGFPLVFVGRDLDGSPGDLVVENDRAEATAAMLRHLVGAGAHRVGLLTLATFESFTADALVAYADWCDARREDPVVETAPGDSTAGLDAFRRAADAFLDRADRPDAVFCLYERLAVEVLRAARERGVDVPGELMVAGVSEMGLARSTLPPLTTLEIEQDVIGATAANLLIDAVEGVVTASVRDVPTRISARASTAR